MTTNKIELKKNAFEYILFKMYLWKEETKIKWLKGEMIEPHGILFDCSLIDFGYSYFTKLLTFFVCTASVDREAMYNFFDNFIIDQEDGIYEKDVDEYFKKHSLNIDENAFNFIEIPYKLIDQAIDYLKKEHPLMPFWSHNQLCFWSKRHPSWQVSNKLTKTLGDEYKKIPLEFLLNEKTAFTPTIKYLSLVG